MSSKTMKSEDGEGKTVLSNMAEVAKKTSIAVASNLLGMSQQILKTESSKKKKKQQQEEEEEDNMEDDGDKSSKGDGLGGASGEGQMGRWSIAEDDALRQAVSELGARNWKRIASEYLHDRRTDVQCLHRWQKVLRPGLVKGPWTDQEDKTIVDCMERGITRWSEVAKLVPGRIGKQCRERWLNHLDPSINKGPWTEEEDRKLIEGQRELGNRWSQIAKMYLPGRPENAVKNRWNAATRRRRQLAGGNTSQTPTNVAKANAGNKSPAEKKRKANKQSGSKKSSKRSKTAPEVGEHSNFAGLDAMVSLASACAIALESVIPGAPGASGASGKKKKAASAKEDKKPKKKKRSTTKEAVARATSNAAAMLTAAASSIEDGKAKSTEVEKKPTTEGAKRQTRGNSFMASRPNLSSPPTVTTTSTVIKEANEVNNDEDTDDENVADTPIWKSPRSVKENKTKGKEKIGKEASETVAALQFLSNASSSKETAAK